MNPFPKEQAGLEGAVDPMKNPYEPTRFQIRRLRVYETCFFLVFLGAAVLAVLLYALGSSNRWEPLPVSLQTESLQDADHLLLAGEGEWLVWVATGPGDPSQSSINLLGAYDLSHPGKTFILHPPPNAGVHPIEVLDEDLIALITVPRTSHWRILKRGWASLTHREISSAKAPGVNPPSERESGFSPQSVTIHLQRVSLITGRVTTMAPGGNYQIGTIGKNRDSLSTPNELSDLERGNVSLSPDRLDLAWWSAREEIGKSPLSATVTEHFEIFSVGPRFKRLLGKEIKTDGTLSIRSRLLQRVGQPVWMTNDRCLILSTLDSGSLIPFNCGEGTIEAAVPLSTLQQTLSEGAPVTNSDPEGFEILPGGNGQSNEILVWTRLPGSLHFFVLDSLFHLVHHTQVEDKDLDLSRPLWLKRSQVLLVEDTSSSRLVGFTATGEREGVYPIPPDWGESFQILGENRKGDLIGYNRGAFLSAKSGDGAWETMELFR